VPSVYVSTLRHGADSPGPPSPGLTASLVSSPLSLDCSLPSTPAHSTVTLPAIVSPYTPSPFKHAIGPAASRFPRGLHTRACSVLSQPATPKKLLDEPRSPYSASFRPDNSLVTLEAGLASLARRADLRGLDISMPSLRYYAPSEAATSRYLVSAPPPVAPLRRMPAARHSSTVWHPHTFAAAPTATTGAAPSADPFARGSASFYADFTGVPHGDIYDLAAYVPPPARKLPIYERWARRILSLSRLRRLSFGGGNTKAKGKRETLEAAQLGARRHAKQVSLPLQQPGVDARPRPRAISTPVALRHPAPLRAVYWQEQERPHEPSVTPRPPKQRPPPLVLAGRKSPPQDTRALAQRPQSQLRPLLLVEKLASAECGDGRASRQIEELIVLLGSRRGSTRQAAGGGPGAGRSVSLDVPYSAGTGRTGVPLRFF
jgi:hypothetical protein